MYVQPELAKALRILCDRHGFAIMCGYRDQREQTRLFELGRSKHPWPQSGHNKFPSRAADVVPTNWTGRSDDECFHSFATILDAELSPLGYDVVWSADEPWHYEVAKCTPS